MNPVRKIILIVVVVCALGGCASPDIFIQPVLPLPSATNTSGDLTPVRVLVAGFESTLPSNRYEEKNDKSQIGESESLGVHLSNFWLKEPPARFIQRVLESDLKAWGYKVVGDKAPIQLHGNIIKFSLNSHAINVFQLQADGVIDVELEVAKENAAPHYKGHYVGTCTFKSATEIPNKENMDKLFNQCVEEFQNKLESDIKLRAALSEN